MVVRGWRREGSFLSCYKFITLFLAYPTPCLDLLLVSFLLWFLLSFPWSPTVPYLISSMQVFHGTQGNLICLSSIQIHIIPSLISAIRSKSPLLSNNALTAGVWRLVENQFHSATVGGSQVAFINCRRGFLTCRTLWCLVKAGGWEAVI